LASIRERLISGKTIIIGMRRQIGEDAWADDLQEAEGATAEQIFAEIVDAFESAKRRCGSDG
jgi:hypothetical protein